MTEIRNILLIGRTGSGKSTLGNVLVNRNGNFDEVFKESASLISETKQVKKEEFESDGIIYRIIDTIGIGHTKLSKEEVLIEIQNIFNEAEDFNLNQVLFVIGGRFTEEEVENYKLLEMNIFDKVIVDFITIVRTRFTYFNDRTECEEDIKKMLENRNKRLVKMINSCNKIIHVDNPPINLNKERESLINWNKRIRKTSRKILLEHLKTCRDVYQPIGIKKFESMIREKKSPYLQIIPEIIGIEEMKIFSTWFNKYCALVTSRAIKKKDTYFIPVPTFSFPPIVVIPAKPPVDVYALSLVIYERTYKKREEYFKSILISDHFTKEDAKKKSLETKEKLQGNIPVLAKYSHYSTNFLKNEGFLGIFCFQNVIDRKLSSNINPEEYLRSYDIVSRKIGGGFTYHFAIYLCNGKVCHITNDGDGGGEISIDNWKTFVKNAKTVTFYHTLIPFKKPQKIKEHIKKALKAEYGKGEYHLLGKNCEHFVSLCVYGVNASNQVKNFFGAIPIIGKKLAGEDSIKEEMEKNDVMFNQLPSKRELTSEEEEIFRELEVRIEVS